MLKAMDTAATDMVVQQANMELARFINPAGLSAVGHNLYLETVASGSPITGTPVTIVDKSPLFEIRAKGTALQNGVFGG